MQLNPLTAEKESSVRQLQFCSKGIGKSGRERGDADSTGSAGTQDPASHSPWAWYPPAPRGRAVKFPRSHNGVSLGRPHQICCCNSDYGQHVASPRPPSQAWHLQICKILWWIWSESSQSSLKEPGKHRKCIHSYIFQRSLWATLSWVFFPSRHPYQQFGFRHLASPLSHSNAPWTGCIKQWALHHRSGSWFPAPRGLLVT